MIIAVDFDGTLCTSKYPKIGMPNVELIESLIARRHMGDKLILWTCRSGNCLDEAVRWCMQHGLYFDAVNDNIPEMIEAWGNDSRKVTADLYIDDRSEKPWDLIFGKVV